MIGLYDGTASAAREKFFILAHEMRIAIYILWLCIGAVTVKADARTRTDIHFENSEHELKIYFIEGKEPGKTLMIIGGIQGDEPGGYLAADLYADMLLRKGNLIVAPRANFYTIRNNQRSINGDMNRKFGPEQPSNNDFDTAIVDILKDLISRSDVLLNLHEGSGFFSPTLISELRNPMRYGQSVIADASTYTHTNGTVIDLEGSATAVINDINQNIENSDHYFHFNNHATLSDSTKHIEQRKSATFYALTVLGIPAFGLETSKDIQSIETKVYYQTLAINAFMKQYGIIPEHPSVSLPPPELDHLVVNLIGNTLPFAVKNGTTLTVPEGSSIQVTSILANYKRGLTLDILGFGNLNDLGRVAKILTPTKIKVFKDAFPCGEVSIETTKKTEETNAVFATPPIELKNIEFTVAGGNIVVSPDDTLHIIRGDVIKISGAQISGTSYSDTRVNFVGFVGNTRFNDGDDRGYYIDTASDLLDRFSVDKTGKLYRIEALYKTETIGTVYAVLHEPEIEYLIVERDDGTKLALTPGSVFQCERKGKIKVVSIISNIQAEPFIETFISNGSGTLKELLLPAVLDTAISFDLQFRRAALDLGSISFRTRG